MTSLFRDLLGNALARFVFASFSFFLDISLKRNLPASIGKTEPFDKAGRPFPARAMEGKKPFPPPQPLT